MKAFFLGVLVSFLSWTSFAANWTPGLATSQEAEAVLSLLIQSPENSTAELGAGIFRAMSSSRNHRMDRSRLTLARLKFENYYTLKVGYYSENRHSEGVAITAEIVIKSGRVYVHKVTAERISIILPMPAVGLGTK